jgi:hypothetical protein
MWAAVHETTSEYTDDIIDFFEATVSATPILSSEHPATTHEDISEASFLGSRKQVLAGMQRPT